MVIFSELGSRGGELEKVIIPAHLNAKRQTTKAKGFTLIELLIVIAILGILAAAVLIAVNPAKRQNQAKDAQVKSDVGSIATALQAYYTQPGAGSYPTTAQGLALLVSNGDLKQIPTPPSGSSSNYTANYTAYPATCDGTTILCTEASLWALMLDQPLGQTDDVWCFESITGKAQALTASSACDNSAVTL